MSAPDAEEAKLVILARGARSRVSAAEGAAIRDDTGRTYSASAVSLPSLTLSAAALAVAVANESDLAVIRDLAGVGVPVLIVDVTGAERTRAHT